MPSRTEPSVVAFTIAQAEPGTPVSGTLTITFEAPDGVLTPASWPVTP